MLVNDKFQRERQEVVRKLMLAMLSDKEGQIVEVRGLKKLQGKLLVVDS